MTLCKRSFTFSRCEIFGLFLFKSFMTEIKKKNKLKTTRSEWWLHLLKLSSVSSSPRPSPTVTPGMPFSPFMACSERGDVCSLFTSYDCVHRGSCENASATKLLGSNFKYWAFSSLPVPQVFSWPDLWTAGTSVCNSPRGTSAGRAWAAPRTCRSPAWTWRRGCPRRWWSSSSPGGSARWPPTWWSWWTHSRTPARTPWRPSLSGWNGENTEGRTSSLIRAAKAKSDTNSFKYWRLKRLVQDFGRSDSFLS